MSYVGEKENRVILGIKIAYISEANCIKCLQFTLYIIKWFSERCGDKSRDENIIVSIIVQSLLLFHSNWNQVVNWACVWQMIDVGAEG